jgi:hypothetical protein
MTSQTPAAAAADSFRIEQGRYAGEAASLVAIDTSRGLASVRLDDGHVAIVQLANMLPSIRAYFYRHGFQAAADTFGEQYVRAALIPTD